MKKLDKILDGVRIVNEGVFTPKPGVVINTTLYTKDGNSEKPFAVMLEGDIASSTNQAVLVFTEEEASRLRIKINPSALEVDNKISLSLRDKTKKAYKIRTDYKPFKDLVLVHYYDDWFTVHWFQTMQQLNEFKPRSMGNHFTISIEGIELTALKI